jgi:hypothetical protein
VCDILLQAQERPRKPSSPAMSPFGGASSLTPIWPIGLRQCRTRLINMEHEHRAFYGVRRTFMKTLIMSVLLIGGIAGASVYAAGAESAGTYVKD